VPAGWRVARATFFTNNFESGAQFKRTLSGGFGGNSDRTVVRTKIPTQGQKTALNGYPAGFLSLSRAQCSHRKMLSEVAATRIMDTHRPPGQADERKFCDFGEAIDGMG